MKVKLLVALFIVLVSPLVFYESRRIPTPAGEDIMVLPQDVSKILGAKSTKPQVSVRVPILLYHYVEYVKDKNDTFRQKLNITPDILMTQIETLKNGGYTFINSTDLTNALSGKIKLPKKVVMLTFDDGYMDFYTDVFPILKKEDAKAVQYVISDFLNRPNFMFSFQLQEIAKNPLVEIGAHTLDHVWLKGMAKETAVYQITQSKKDLENMINHPVNSFAYPFGAFDEQAIELTRNAGFTNAVSTVPGIEQTNNSQYFLYRLRPGYRTGQDLLDYLESNSFRAY